MNNFDLEAICNRNLALAQERKERFAAFLATHPQSKPCVIHPTVMRTIDPESSRRHSTDAAPVAVYARCPECKRADEIDRENKRLHSCGVPSELLTANLDNWDPKGDEAKQGLLNSVRRFEEVRRGFLVILGAYGTGKSHLAVAVLRQFRRPFMVTQFQLLRMLRDTYSNRQAPDPVEKCQGADLLVLDELGVSGGGRDELPLLHEILNYRHCEKLPTILTGNIQPKELSGVIGGRLADRLGQSAFGILLLAGQSHRPQVKDRYFEA